MAGSQNTRPPSGERRVTRSRPRSQGGGLFQAALKGGLVAGCVVVMYLAYNHYKKVSEHNERVRAQNEEVRRKNAQGEGQYEYEQGNAYVRDRDGNLKEKAQPAIGETAKAPDGAPRGSADPSEQFEQFMADGDKHFYEAAFEQAAASYAKAATFPAPADRVNRISEAAKACRVFADLTEGVKPSVEAKADNLYLIKLKGTGAEIRAKVTNRNATTVWYIKDNIRGQLPRENIASMTPVEQEDRDREMREKLEDIRSKAFAEKDSLSFYLAAMQALEFDFRKDAAKLLQKAWSVDQDAGRNLADTVRAYEAAKMFKIGAWYYSVGVPQRGEKKFNELIAMYPDTQAAEEARRTMEELRRRQELVYINQQRIKKMQEREARKRRESDLARARAETSSKPESPEEHGKELLDLARDSGGDVTGKDMETIRKANAAFAEGVDAYNKGMSVASARESNRHYKHAEKKLTEAVGLYNKALAKDPNNQDIQKRAQSAQSKLYWSKKSQRVGM